METSGTAPPGAADGGADADARRGAVRDSARAPDDAREDLQRTRHRLGKLLWRRACTIGVAIARRAPALDRRPRVGACGEQVVVDDYVLTVDHLEARPIELDAQLVAVADTAPPHRDGWLAAVFPRHRHV